MSGLIPLADIVATLGTVRAVEILRDQGRSDEQVISALRNAGVPQRDADAAVLYVDMFASRCPNCTICSVDDALDNPSCRKHRA